MKKVALHSIIIFYFSTIATAQSAVTPEVQNLYNQNYKYITYLGMDFSKVVFIGDFSEIIGLENDASTKNAYFKAWNNLVTGEFEKYDIKLLVNNKNITTNLDGVMKLNYATKVDELSGIKEPDYTLQSLQQHFNDYTLPADKGLGVIWLVESFNRNTSKAIIDFVVIDMSNKKIVLLKKLETNPRGSGLRNYWAGSIYEAFKEVEKNITKVWKNEYNWN